MTFREAWANPVCSTTRATILTGRYSFRTGVGALVTVGAPDHLRPEETTIPEAIDLIASDSGGTRRLASGTLATALTAVTWRRMTLVSLIFPVPGDPFSGI